MTKAERIRLFLEGLAEAAPCADQDEAFGLIGRTLNEIEDEHSGVAFNPDTWAFDGRLYPPQDDRAIDSKEHRAVVKYRSVGHWTLIASNGAFQIVEIKSGKIVLDRGGRDGKTVASFALRRR